MSEMKKSAAAEDSGKEQWRSEAYQMRDRLPTKSADEKKTDKQKKAKKTYKSYKAAVSAMEAKTDGKIAHLTDCKSAASVTDYSKSAMENFIEDEKVVDCDKAAVSMAEVDDSVDRGDGVENITKVLQDEIGKCKASVCEQAVRPPHSVTYAKMVAKSAKKDCGAADKSGPMNGVKETAVRPPVFDDEKEEMYNDEDDSRMSFEAVCAQYMHTGGLSFSVYVNSVILCQTLERLFSKKYLKHHPELALKVQCEYPRGMIRASELIASGLLPVVNRSMPISGEYMIQAAVSCVHPHLVALTLPERRSAAKKGEEKERCLHGSPCHLYVGSPALADKTHEIWRARTTMFVYNIPAHLTHSQIVTLFEPFGTVTRLHLNTDGDWNWSEVADGLLSTPRARFVLYVDAVTNERTQMTARFEPNTEAEFECHFCEKQTRKVKMGLYDCVVNQRKVVCCSYCVRKSVERLSKLKMGAAVQSEEITDPSRGRIAVQWYEVGKRSLATKTAFVEYESQRMATRLNEARTWITGEFGELAWNLHKLFGIMYQ